MNKRNALETAIKIVIFKVSLLTTESEPGFESSVLAIRNWEMNPDQDAYQSSIKMLQHWIGGMQSTQNYSGIDTWPLHIPIHNLSSLEKNTKSGHKNLLKGFTLINRRNVVFLRDNARLHSAKHTKEIILDWGWSVQPHPRYSPDLTTTDFNLFGFL